MTTPVRFCQVAIKWMIERKRRVVINVASTTLIAKMGIIYARSKAGLVMFSEMLKHMCNVKDIHIQALCQGFEHIEFLRHEGKNLQKIQTLLRIG